MRRRLVLALAVATAVALGGHGVHAQDGVLAGAALAEVDAAAAGVAQSLPPAQAQAHVASVLVHPTDDLAVLAAPQFDDADVALIQMGNEAHETSDADATDAASHAATTESTTQASLDSTQLAAMEAAASAAAAQSEAADADAQAAAEMEAEMEAEAEADMQAEADVAAETQTQTETEADSEASADTETDVDADADADEEDSTPAARSLIGTHAAANEAKADDSQPGAPADAGSDVDKPKKQKKSSKSDESDSDEKKPAAKPTKPKHVPGNTVVKVERTAPLPTTVDVVHLKNGKKLYKSRVVNPNIRYEEVPRPKPLRHSRERIMTDAQAKHFTRQPAIKGGARKKRMSEVRKAFLRLNPEQAPKSKKAHKKHLSVERTAYSPYMSLENAFRRGDLAQLRFDPPTIATSLSVQHEVHLQQHAPTVRRRAELKALQTASTTLKRINAKRHEYKRALKALKQARDTLQQQIHRHHVIKAREAKREAIRAQRRAAWSAVLQNPSLRKDLKRTLGGHQRLHGEARRKAIEEVIRRHVSPQQRARLHAYIYGEPPKAHIQKAAAAPAPKQPAHAAHHSKPAGDSAALEALIARINVALVASNQQQAATQAAALAAASAQQAPAKKPTIAAKKLAAAAKKPAAATKPAVTPAAKATAARFAQFESAQAVANDATQEALAQLGIETEVDDIERDAPLLHLEAEVDAATHETDELLHEMHL